jgi:iron(III) transport system substrate-binding protein
MRASLGRFSAGIALTLVAVLVAACGQAAPASPTVAPAPPTSAPAAKEAAKPTAAPAAKEAAAPAAKEAAKPAAAGSAANWSQEHEQWVKTTHEAAQKEGKVVVYGFWNPDLEAVTKEFMQKHYPGVELETLTSTTASEKIRTEAQTGQYTADVYLGGQTTAYTLYQLELSEQFAPPAEKDPAAKWVLPPSSYTSYPQVIYALQGKGVLINTRLVPPDREPKTWQDLLQPFWSGGKIVLDHPGRGGGPGGSWARWAFDQTGLGRPFLEGLKAQNVVLASGSATPQLNAVARGEYFGYIPAYPSALEQVKGAPLKFIWPEPGTGGGTTSLVVHIRNAPHPNAAKLFMNMFLLPDFQQQVAGTLWQTPNRQGVPLPDPIISFEGHNVSVDTEEQIKTTTAWTDSVGREIFGQ